MVTNERIEAASSGSRCGRWGGGCSDRTMRTTCSAPRLGGVVGCRRTARGTDAANARPATDALELLGEGEAAEAPGAGSQRGDGVERLVVGEEAQRRAPRPATSRSSRASNAGRARRRGQRRRRPTSAAEHRFEQRVAAAGKGGRSWPGRRRTRGRCRRGCVLRQTEGGRCSASGRHPDSLFGRVVVGSFGAAVAVHEWPSLDSRQYGPNPSHRPDSSSR